MTRVNVSPVMLRWARERAGIALDDLTARFPRLIDWENQAAQPTLKQMETYARATHAPIGYFFLPAPPVERVPIPDFRTVASRPVDRPSPDLLETVYICQQRQEWYRDFARSLREDPISFVGSLSVDSDIVDAAGMIRTALHFDLEERAQCPTWTDALRRFTEQADAAGVLVMVNSVVGNNTHRKLDAEEFRGFALSDAWAPLVFVNGADTKAAQMFTLAHELAHLWLGESALSNVDAATTPRNRIEGWCNRVAAELLVPLAIFRQHYRVGEDLRAAMDRLARRFKVSTLVVLRRIYDLGALTRDAFWGAYREERDRLSVFTRGSGGNFYLTEAARVGKRFARALVSNTLEGQTLHRDAFHLLGFSKLSTLHELAHSLGVA